MSYWVTLVDDYGQSVPVDAHTAGGVHEEGECRVAEMNVTSNYAKHFDFRMLDGKFGSQTIGEPGFIVIIRILHRGMSAMWWIFCCNGLRFIPMAFGG